MARKKENRILPHVSYVCIGDKPPVRWDSLSKQERAEISDKMMQNVSDNLSKYANLHPEEFASLV